MSMRFSNGNPRGSVSITRQDVSGSSIPENGQHKVTGEMPPVDCSPITRPAPKQPSGKTTFLSIVAGSVWVETVQAHINAGRVTTCGRFCS